MRHSVIHSNSPLIKILLSVVSLALSLLVFFGAASAQEPGTRKLPSNLPMSEGGPPSLTALAPSEAARGNDLYCAGFIDANPLSKRFQIIGAEEENTRPHLAQGDVVYINAGQSQGVEPNMLFSVVRPLGHFRTPFKGGAERRLLGVYTQELGLLRVIASQETTATARIIFSCSDIQLGDLLHVFEERRAPATDIVQPLPRYSPPSGKRLGRIVLERNQKEMISPRDIVYIDLGAESGVRAGDRFTIFRRYPDDAKSVRFNDDNIIVRQSRDFQSDSFKGGPFSNDHPYEERQKVKNNRQPIPRKVVGELVIISVQSRSATAVVTRTTQEVHPGDWVELQ